MPGFLQQHALARSQYRPRRSEPTGGIAVHSAENITDLVLPDGGAEAVARYMLTRTTPGSYADVVDSDSGILLVDYDLAAFHDGTGSNDWSTSISFACKAHQWPTLTEWWISGAITNAAAAARRQSDWVYSKRGFHVPARRITAAQYRSGIAGFVSHAQLDPTRRTDPGEAFPWDRFLAAYAATHATPPTGTTIDRPTTAGDPAMVRDFIETSYLNLDRDPDRKGVAYWWRKTMEEAPNRQWTYADCLASPTLQYMVGLLTGQIKP